jgi:hypothetical protein
VSVKEPVHPAKQYVNGFLFEMLQAETRSCRVQLSGKLPIVLGQQPPEFARFRNRLKIMAGLDPVIYPMPRAGSFNVMINRQVDGQWYECYYAVRMLFDDSANDPSVELSSELARKEPGIDPKLCL